VAGSRQETSDTADLRMAHRQISLMVGLMYVTVGTLRLGFLTNFLSRSVIAGFTCGAALVIGVSQAGPRSPNPAVASALHSTTAFTASLPGCGGRSVPGAAVHVLRPACSAA